jgi:flagellar biogenesis protein FliO
MAQTVNRKAGSALESRPERAPGSGLAAWLLDRLRGAAGPKPSLVLVERITLAPRQTLALVEAEGRRFLIATSPEGAPAFHALDERGRGTGSARVSAGSSARVSW